MLGNRKHGRLRHFFRLTRSRVLAQSRVLEVLPIGIQCLESLHLERVGLTVAIELVLGVEVGYGLAVFVPDVRGHVFKVFCHGVNLLRLHGWTAVGLSDGVGTKPALVCVLVQIKANSLLAKHGSCRFTTFQT